MLSPIFRVKTNMFGSFAFKKKMNFAALHWDSEKQTHFACEHTVSNCKEASQP